jgi:spore cortex biosynthesis protein YabQ
LLMSVSAQAYIFLYSIVGGVIIAFIYDIFRVKRRAVKTSMIFVYVEDLVFWIIVGAVMFAVIYLSNEGEVRGYIFIGSLLGIIAYNLIFSRIVMAAFLFIIKTIYRLVRFLCRLISYPFRAVFGLLSFPAKSAAKFLKKAYYKVKGAGRNRAARLSIWRRRIKNIRKKI